MACLLSFIAWIHQMPTARGRSLVLVLHQLLKKTFFDFTIVVPYSYRSAGSSFSANVNSCSFLHIFFFLHGDIAVLLFSILPCSVERSLPASHSALLRRYWFRRNVSARQSGCCSMRRTILPLFFHAVLLAELVVSRLHINDIARINFNTWNCTCTIRTNHNWRRARAWRAGPHPTILLRHARTAAHVPAATCISGSCSIRGTGFRGRPPAPPPRSMVVTPSHYPHS